MIIAIVQAISEGRAERAAKLRRAAWLAIPIAVLAGALVLPPLLANPEALALKSGVDTPTFDTWVGAWHAWLGTGSWAVAVAGAALALLGATLVRRNVPESAALLLGAILAVILLYLSRPLASQHGIIAARYLLPLLPLVLLAVAAGTMRVAQFLAPSAPRWTYAACAAGVIVTLLVLSPVDDWLRRPNRHASHIAYYFDFRSASNPIAERLDGIPRSEFWRTLRADPAGSRVVAIAPFYFESFDSAVPRWERESGQSIIPGLLSGLCVDWRWGEVPPSYPFDLRNAVRLSDPASLRARAVDLVVWEKPYLRGTEIVGEGTAHCEAALRDRFGTPSYEDHAIAVFELAPRPR